MQRSITAFLVLTLGATVCLPPVVAAQAAPLAGDPPILPRAGATLGGPLTAEWCDTHIVWAKKREPLYGPPPRGECPTEGPCDEPAERDAHIPDASTPAKVIRLHFLVFREDDGSNPAATAGDVPAQADEMNAVYDFFRIQFSYTWQFVDDTTYRYLADDAEIDPMKQAYGVSPNTQCNIFVTDLHGGLGGRGTFP